MDWESLSRLLDDQIDYLQRSPAAEFEPSHATESMREAIQREHAATHDAVTEACRSFARDQSWTRMPPIQCYFVVQRLKFARELTTIFRLRQPTSRQEMIPYPSASTEDMLEWLLLETWNMGYRYLLMRLDADKTSQTPFGDN